MRWCRLVTRRYSGGKATDQGSGRRMWMDASNQRTGLHRVGGLDKRRDQGKTQVNG